MIRKISRFLNASSTERRDLSAAWIALLQAAWQVNRRGGRRGAWKSIAEPPGEVTPEQLATAESVHRMVAAASTLFPVKPMCLTRSVALYRLLQRRGIPATLRIGVSKETGKLAAHAWVECGERQFGLAGETQSFQAFDSAVSPP